MTVEVVVNGEVSCTGFDPNQGIRTAKFAAAALKLYEDPGKGGGS